MTTTTIYLIAAIIAAALSWAVTGYWWGRYRTLRKLKLFTIPTVPAKTVGEILERLHGDPPVTAKKLADALTEELGKLDPKESI